MSYSIDYNPELHKNYPMKRKKMILKPLGITICLLSAVYMIYSFGLINFLIPGDPDVTVSAFSEMVDGVQNGQPVSDAVYMFCKCVIAGDNQYDSVEN